MQRRERDGLVWLEFDLLADIPELVHGIFSRHGGSSTGPYDSLNFSITAGDTQENVVANMSKVGESLQLPLLFKAGCVHGKEIVSIDSATSSLLAKCDGLTTTLPNVGLLITHADCQAAIFYDPILKVAGNIHCGWRGNVQNVYREAVQHMRNHYGSKPENLLVGISPSLGPDEAEFVNYKSEIPSELHHFKINSCHFDLWAMSEMQLLESGVLPHHIEVAKISTYASPRDFFSYRRDKVCGRNGTIVGIRPKNHSPLA